MSSTPIATAPAGAPDGLALAEEAEALLAARDIDHAVRIARRALDAAPDDVRVWMVVAKALEAQGDIRSALDVYNAAGTLSPDMADVTLALARIALRTNANDSAERMFAALIEAGRGSAEVLAGLGAAQARRLDFAAAHATLRAALEADAGDPRLWIALAELLCIEGRQAQSLVFFEEALRIGPRSATALTGLADALLASGGDVGQALELSAEAIGAAPPHAAGPLQAEHGRRLLSVGRLAEGWAATLVGVDPALREDLWVRLAAPRWTPDAPLSGRLLLMGEEDAAAEILLTAAIPELPAEPPLILAVGQAWAPLARRSFPAAHVVTRLSRPKWSDREEAAELDTPHLHEGELLGAWAPLRLVTQRRRPSLDAFARPRPWLVADPGRTTHWRSQLAGLGPAPKVGLAWRLPSADPKRAWETPTAYAQAQPLSEPGIVLVAFQHGGAMAEADWLQVILERPLVQLPGLAPLELDDRAALACALDVVIGPPGVETFLAAACGAETWIITSPGHWAMLGTETFPWFPSVRVFLADGPGEWDRALAELGEALAALAARA